ncbi:MAG: ABC transporter ATP-binding protein [Candidatus Bathyarchaeia archaeon]
MLITESLTKSFGGLKAVNSVDFEAKEKCITLLIGPNGSGKTTLVNTVTGYYKPDSGKVYFKGEDITGLPMHETYRKGLVRTFQIPSPFSQISVLENLLVAARFNPGEHLTKHLFRNSWKKYEDEYIEKAFKILQLLKLDEFCDEQPASLSAGHLKLIEIGRALAAEAKMVILDEPIAGINPVFAHDIFSHIVDIKKELGITFLIVEHRLDIALKYADYVYVMNEGKVICKGTPDYVVNDEGVRKVYIGD